MKTLLTIFLLSLPCSALAGEFNFDLKGFEQELDKPATSQLRIVRCTQGLAAVQDYRGLDVNCSGVPWNQPCNVTEEWRTITGCVPIEAAKRMYAEEVAWRNRPPAPSVIEPVEVIEP